MLRSRFDRTKTGLAGLWVAVAISGCANVGQQDPSADNAAAGAQAAAAATAASGAAVQAQQAASDALTTRTVTTTKTVHYRVKRGDTLARIAQKNNCSVKDLLAWNRMSASAHVKKGQVLRIVTQQTVTTTVDANGKPVTARTPANSATAREMAAQTTRAAKTVTLMWPAQGVVVEPFQAGETRGIEIAGKAGDPVRAAADGKVMYAGTGLNEYGSLIIVQHNKDFLTAYSHNRKLLVKTGDIVHQGQLIAEMGNENNTRVSVLFELRHDGKPIDPIPYLPQGRG
ncbi:peptidoglycan DD-metalloendopeptidase family protein [Paraburkholderia sp.]|uniref:peptidoglycan DD-metalloendopeptidase family protein n=1 Tax=Paraburkholderia sp. TaxID=1926495 RepID=UPI0025811298|nr:peptidoglycan DD-metalloendopeptidase family protein [Paraburkholderia sp.]